MNEHDATEVAFNNGYKQGTADAVQKMAERIKAYFNLDSEYTRHTEGYIRYVVDRIAKEMEEGV